MTVKQLLLTLTLVLAIGLPKAQAQEDIIIGKRFSLHSDVLNEDRHCIISLPDSYDAEDAQHYPVMILLDGYTHFKTTAATVHFMSSASNRNRDMPEMIVVAIENVDRERDFTHTKIQTVRVNTMGGGPNFLNFIEQELIPYVDAHYRTEPSRILVGHSLGGLLAVNAYRDPNSMFDGYIAVDPSIWWEEALIREKVAEVQPSSFEKRIYIATANQGPANQQKNKIRHDKLFALLQEKAGDDLHMKVEYFDEEDHRSVVMVAIYQGLKYLYAEEEE